MKINQLLLTSLLILFFNISNAQNFFEGDGPPPRPEILTDCPLGITNAGPDKLICPSPGSVQIGTNPQAGSFYSWTPVGGLSDPNISNPIASPLLTTTYTVRKLGNNLIDNGDFEQGNVAFTSDYIFTTSSNGWGAGHYGITSNPQILNPPFCSTSNHTVGGSNMMLVDGLFNFQPNNIFWSQTFPILDNKTYLFSAWFYSASFLNYHNPPDPAYWPIIEIRINGTLYSTTALPYTNCSGWIRVEFPYTSNTTTATLDMTCNNYWGGQGGNDFAVDDISFRCLSNSDQVVVNVCNPGEITANSYYAKYDCQTPGTPYINYPIIPSAQNNFCSYYECGGFGHFISNIPTNNQWYVNDVLVTASGNSILGSLDISNPAELKQGLCAGSGHSFKIQVKNTTYGFQQLSAPTYVYYAEGIGPGEEWAGFYKPNYIQTYTIPHGRIAGPNASYYWSLPSGCTVTNIDPSGFTVQIDFGSVGTNGINGFLYINNTYCSNNPIPISFTYNSQLRSSVANVVEGDNIIKIYPNPASDLLNFESVSDIKSIEFFDFLGNLKKQSFNLFNKKVSINILELKPGVYNCKILTAKGLENKRIVVKR